MNKLEKCYYVVIENKKRGKFYGAGSSQVAKKVASKKLKSGKEMEFYLDEVAGKKKRLGPYQARKDKKTGLVFVVKGRKVMKGGVLSENDKSKLRNFFFEFNNSNNVIIKSTNKLKQFLSVRLPLISFGHEPIVFFNPIYIRSVMTDIRYSMVLYKYMFAVFKEGNGNIYIMIYNYNKTSEIVNMTEFFLNPKYSMYFKGSNILSKQDILLSLQNPENIESRRIRDEAGKICELLYIPTGNESKQKVIIYIPNYSHPLIRKCVYPDSTFGVLDEENETGTRIQEFPIPESNYQKFLILKKTGLRGMSVNEPVIYVRVPLELKSETKSLIFDYCIYYSSNDNKLRITGINYNEEFIIDNGNLRNLNSIIFSILFGIPVEFGRFSRIREVSKSILKYHNTKGKLPLQLNSIIRNISKNSKQNQLEKQITQLQQIIESLKLLEPKEPEAQLNKAYRKLTIFPELKTQLNEIQSLIQNLQPRQTFKQPQQNLEQQLSQLQKLLTDKLIEQKKLKLFTNNHIPIQDFKNSNI